MRPSVVFLIALVGWSSVEVVRSQSAGESTVEVNLKQGAIKTSKIDLADEKYYYAFKSIPYAEPPVGTLQFKDPVPAGPWSGVRNGSVKTTPCPQVDMMTFFTDDMQTTGEEDCLFLDVYTPRPYSSDLPVMVWIHGGGFILGDIESYSPVYLMAKDVVVVCIQYRLGTLGFLSTEDSVIPGNRGMKDQVLALRWVQENIRDLGGDPSRVTIFGESAGGISVHFHMLSPMSKGLFHRAIAQSGTALFPGFIRSDHREKAAALGQMLECPGVDPAALDSQALYDCLQNVPKEKLVMLSGAFVEFMTSPQVMMPSVDGEFLPDHPATLMKEGKYHKVDFMTGVTRDEGAVSIRPLFYNTSVIDSLVQNFATNGPIILNLESDDESKVYVAKRIFYHYLGNIEITEGNADSAMKIYSDMMFNIPMDLSGKMHSRDAAYGKKIFLYEFHHLGGEFSLLDTPHITIGKQWVAHGDELQYLFQSLFSDFEMKKVQNKFMSEIMVTLWTNFAATGDPTPDMSLGFKWSPISGPDLRFLILKPSPYMRDYTRSDEMEFWMNLPTKYNKKYYPERFA